MMEALPFHFYLVESQVQKVYLLPWQYLKGVCGTCRALSVKLFPLSYLYPCLMSSGDDCNLLLVILGTVQDYRFFPQLLPRISQRSMGTPECSVGGTSVSLVTQSGPTLCDPMDCSMPGFPVHHQLLELAQTYIHRVLLKLMFIAQTHVLRWRHRNALNYLYLDMLLHQPSLRHHITLSIHHCRY